MTNQEFRVHEAANVLEPFAVRLLKSGQERIAIDLVAELARQELQYSVVNTDKPHIARELLARHPGLKGKMRTKPLGRGGKHKPREQVITVADLRRAYKLGYEAGLKATSS